MHSDAAELSRIIDECEDDGSLEERAADFLQHEAKPEATDCSPIRVSEWGTNRCFREEESKPNVDEKGYVQS